MSDYGDFIIPAWLEGQDVDSIHKGMLGALPANVDNTEGGWPWNFTRPTALEAAEMLQFQLVETMRVMHPMWAYGEYLDRHAVANGTERKLANSAYALLEITGVSGTAVPIGYCFAVPSSSGSATVEFAIVEAVTIGSSGSVQVAARAVVPGPGGNVAGNTIRIMSSTPITGIVSVTNPEPASGGTLEEGDDSLRERIMFIIRGAENSYTGCPSDYMTWAMEIAGVGNVQVISEAEGPGTATVKLIVVDSNGHPANDMILDVVRANIMGTTDDPMTRKAPIGAILTVISPDSVEIDVSISDLQIEADSTKDAVIEANKANLQSYFASAAADGIVRLTQICAALANAEGVVDFGSVTVNGGSSNVSLGDDEYPVIGTITAEVIV